MRPSEASSHQCGRADTGAGEPRDKSRVPQAPSVQVPSTLPEGRNRVPRVRVALPARAHARGANAHTAVHDGDVIPRLVVALGNVVLVAGTVPSRKFLVVDGLNPLREEPREHEALVREGLCVANGGDAFALPVCGEIVDNDPFHHRVVRVVAVQQPEAVDILALVRMLARKEELPAPELRVVHALDGRDVRLEGGDHPLALLAETDAEGTVRFLTLGPRRSRFGEFLEHLFRDAPVAGHVLRAECHDLVVDALLEGVGIQQRFRILQHFRHEGVVAHELLKNALGGSTAETEETREKLTSLIDVDHGRVLLQTTCD